MLNIFMKIIKSGLLKIEIAMNSDIKNKNEAEITVESNKIFNSPLADAMNRQSQMSVSEREEELMDQVDEALERATIAESRAKDDRLAFVARIDQLKDELEKAESRLQVAREALENIEALICDKELCGHWTAEEIREQIAKAIAAIQNRKEPSK